MSTLQTVEVLNTETLQWSTAADLPQPLSLASVAVCGDQIYITGETNMYSCMYTCSALTLIQSSKSFLASLRNRGVKIWKEVAAPEVELTTFVSIHGRLLAIGGVNFDNTLTTAIHMYSPTTDSWKVISHMRTPRRDCIAAFFPQSNQLMVVGGFTPSGESSSVEFAYVE